MPCSLVRVFALVCLMLSSTAQALKPEDVLGEYWNDPLFGAAAAQFTVDVEILHRKLWPEEIAVPQFKNVRFVVTNKSEELHLLAFSSHPGKLMADEKFMSFVKDDVHHALMKPVVDGNHTHAGGDVDNPQPLVKKMSQNPTVIVRPNEFKEVLISFDEPGSLELFCVLEDHADQGYRSLIVIEERPAILTVPES